MIPWSLRERGIACTFLIALVQLLICLWPALSSRADEPPVTALAFDAQRQELIVGSQAGLDVYAIHPQQLIRQVKIDLDHVHDIVLSPSGEKLLVVGGSPSEYGQLTIYAWPKGDKLVSREVFADVIYRAGWTSDGNSIVATALDGQTEVMDEQLRPLQSYAGHTRAVTALATYQPHWVASAGIEGTIHLWCHKDGQSHRVLDGHTAEVRDMTIRQTTIPELVSVGADRTVRLWQPTIGRQVRFARLDTVPVCVAWYSDDLLVVGCEDGTVRWLETKSMQIQRQAKTRLQPIYAIVVAEDLVIAGGQGGFEVLK